VDYAHKSDALEKVLKNLQRLRGSHRLITVMGCGGDRDRMKRPVMGKIAETFSDAVIVTSDNPRTENPDSIIEEIVRGMSGKGFTIQPDRRKAIFEAIAQARPGDLVLIAGKGHEDYQIIGTKKHPFDDRKVALEALF
jgi:UDP-N-acetylmuramoyl-L-alanyl-D-glutamate--2,6-diaminopimelate ligase